MTPPIGIQFLSRIQNEYAETPDRLTQSECEAMAIATAPCQALVSALGQGRSGEITVEEYAQLQDAGFSHSLIQGLAGTDGKAALQARVRWLGENAVGRGWRSQYDPKHREAMVVELGNIGPDAAGAVPQLIKMLRDREVNFRLLAVRALREIGPAATPAVSALQVAAKEETHSFMRQAALQALEQIGTASTSTKNNSDGQ